MPGYFLKILRVLIGPFVIYCAALIPVLTGCGIKAPPVAPQQKPLTAVADLRADLLQDHVRLTWSHKPGNQGAEAYVILRAQRELTQPECTDCPLVFQKAGIVSLSKSMRKEKQLLEFAQSLAPGFHYTFSVRPVLPSGAQGPDSNLVIIEW